MSRVANNPIDIPAGVECKITGNIIKIKGSKGSTEHCLHDLVTLNHEDNVLKMSTNSNSKLAHALVGTTRAVLQNIVTGVHVGFERKLIIIGIGYRVQAKENYIDLSLGFSHAVKVLIPEGITIDIPSQTEIIVKGIDKQKVGQMAADIRAYRPVEPYKGKGIRYADEKVVKKEAKKT